MRCPHCYTKVNSGADACSCGFSAAALRQFLGSEWIRLERITDHSRRLSLTETRELEAALDDFERAFPQVFMAVYLGPLPTELTVSDFGFWLINHGAFGTHVAAKRNDFGIVLVIDPLRQTAGFTIGYALETVLPERALLGVLHGLRRPLSRSNTARAIQKGVKGLQRCLRGNATRHPREMSQQAPPSGDLSILGLETLRSGHQPNSYGSRLP